MYPPLGLRRGGRSHLRRLVALVAAPLLGVSLIAAAPSTAAITDGTDQGATPAVADADFAPGLLPGDAEPVAVTLITGDTVLWQNSGDGNPRVAEIEQASRDHPVTFDQSGTQEDFYVIPTDVMEQVVSGALDRELFNIPSLIRQGLDDKSTGGELPVIVTFDKSADAKKLERDADALPAASEAQGIEGIQGAGVKVDRGKAAKFRDTVLGEPDAKRGPSAQSDSLDGAVDKVLLDQMLQIDLSDSVPQIGAPDAWEAGFTGEGVTVAVLDTGVDATHPDLAGQMVAEANFTDETDATDTHGHGTHVAATIAGTGAASDGARRGVAPDADLLSGKVCNAEGQCPTSAVMAGMEWAAAQGADVVNMSLGGAPTDGTDPLSQLVNELSAESGTLFVISAGNAGVFDGVVRVVGSPAAADAALAVGAVDKSDQMAFFSSRGPRVGDHAVKPEITAPGVGIVAARAAGTSLGGPVDDDYTSLDGTSMAAPHVAGAAALLAQANGLTGQGLKDALVSTAADGGHRWYSQGAGRVDVPAALDSPVYAQGTLNFGGVDGQAEQDLVYTNRSEDTITLSLDVAVADLFGKATGGLTLSADTLTVPAHGTASVTVIVTLDASDLTGKESFGGVVTAAAPDGVTLRTGIGFGSPLHRITIEVLDSNGDHVGSDSAVESSLSLTHDSSSLDHEHDGDRVDSSLITTVGTDEGIAGAHVASGTYTIIADVIEHEPGNWQEISRISLLVEVEIDIDTDTTIVLDARDAVPAQVSVPRTADKRNHSMAVIRELPGADGAAFTRAAIGGGWPLYAAPAPAGELAPVSLFVSWTLAEPQPVQPLPWSTEEQCLREPHDHCYSETPAYVYNLPILYDNGIPQDLHKRISRRDLVEVPTHIHSDHPDALIRQIFESWPQVVGPGSGIAVRMWSEPGEIVEYFLADDRITWKRTIHTERRPDGEPRQTANLASFDWFPAAEAGDRRGEERWWDAPIRMGAADIRDEFRDNPLQIEQCAAHSRGGPDGNQFVQGWNWMDNTRGHSADVAGMASWRMWNLDTGNELELVGGQRAPACPIPLFFSLADEEAVYRLVQVEDYPAAQAGLFLTGRATTTWMFTSRPSAAQVPDSYQCPITHGLPDELWEDTCQIQPLIQLEYDLGLDINNRANAGRAHTFMVTAGHHSKAIDRSKVTDLSVEASFDDGETWTDARVVGKPKDSWDTGGFLPSSAPYQEYKVVVKVPPLHRTDGFVALRVKAEDANGGTVEQTIHRTYILKEGDTRGQGANGPR